MQPGLDIGEAVGSGTTKAPSPTRFGVDAAGKFVFNGHAMFKNVPGGNTEETGVTEMHALIHATKSATTPLGTGVPFKTVWPLDRFIWKMGTSPYN